MVVHGYQIKIKLISRIVKDRDQALITVMNAALGLNQPDFEFWKQGRGVYLSLKGFMIDLQRYPLNFYLNNNEEDFFCCYAKLKCVKILTIFVIVSGIINPPLFTGFS